MIIFSDFDGTLTSIKNPWQLLFEECGVWDDAALFFARWLNKEISYEEFVTSEVELLSRRHIDLAKIEDVLESVTMTKEAHEFIRHTTFHNIPIFIVSTGIRKIIRKETKSYNNVFIISNDINTTTLELTLKVSADSYPSSNHKGQIVDDVIQWVSHTHSIAIGDSLGDIEMFRRATYPVLVNSNDDLDIEVNKRCRVDVGLFEEISMFL